MPNEVAVSAKGGDLVVQQEQTMLGIIAGAARDPSVDVAKLSELLRLKERIDALEAEKAYNQAMSRLQPKLPRVAKNGKIDLGKGKPLSFAKYEDIDTVVRPMLTAEGFSVSFSSDATPGAVMMICTISHVQGHSKSSRMQLPPDAGPGRNGLQAMGSARSYGKRYLLCDMLNIVTENVDDDATAVGFVTDQQLDAIMSLLERCGVNADPTIESGFLKFMNAKSPGEIFARDFKKAVTALESKLRKVQG